MSCAVAYVFLSVAGILLCSLPVLVVWFVIRWITRRPKKKIGILVLITIVLFCALETIGAKNRCQYEIIEQKNAECTFEGYIYSKCLKCGKEKEEVIPSLGHKWNTLICTEVKKCVRCEIINYDIADHKWKNASCLSAKSCELCEAIEGDPLGHDWEIATCLNPKTCKICSATEGTTIEHTWQDATCTSAPKCTTCGKEQGKILDHNWVSNEENTIKECSMCGTQETVKQPEESKVTSNWWESKETKYEKAVAAVNNGDIETAKKIFSELPKDYSNGDNWITVEEWIDSIDLYYNSPFIGLWIKGSYSTDISREISESSGVYLSYSKKYTSPGDITIRDHGWVRIKEDGITAKFTNASQGNAKHYTLVLTSATTIEVYFKDEKVVTLSKYDKQD